MLGCSLMKCDYNNDQLNVDDVISNEIVVIDG